MALIDKDKLVAKINELKEHFINERDDFEKGYHSSLNAVSDYLDSLEVKEADLEKEMSEYFVEHPDEFFSEKYKLFAKHFFELGLKAKKGK